MRLRRRAVLAAFVALLSGVLVGAAGAADPASALGAPLAGGAVASPGGIGALLPTASTPAIVRGRTLRGQPAMVYSTTGLITKLAADANRFAVKSAGPRSRSCGQIKVWTAPSRGSKIFSVSNCTSILCRARTGCVDELALGAGQVAWLARSGGNNLELIVYAAKLSGGLPKRIAYASNGYGAGGSLPGQWLGHLFGAGPVLAYNTWDVVCTADPEVGCGGLRDPALRVTNEKLVRASADRRDVVRRGEGSRPLSAVGGGRMAVESGGAVSILAASGARLATIPAVEGDPPRSIALSSSSLAVMRTFSLDLYNAANGTKAKSIPFAPIAALQLTGLNSSVALFRGTQRLVLLRLRDGKAIALPLPAAAATNLVDARLTASGLFHAYNVPRATAKGRIVFEPTARLLARF
jgi:hypothetical protein